MNQNDMMDGPIANSIDKNAEKIIVTTLTTESGDDLPREHDHIKNNNDNNNSAKMLVGNFSKMPEILVHICTK